MAQKFTTGNWTVSYQHYPTEPKKIAVGVGVEEKVNGGIYTKMICNSILPDSDIEYFGKKKERIEADMKIMAASKDLLEALIRIKKFVDEDFPPKVALGKRSKEYTEAWQNMKEAIKKATE
jgi:hypothetical protein